ncbi:MAG TPA: hypothetical protein VFA83_11950 [Acidimicrobiales bacterium]|nr:hypothetical protein [Acidimicrobiales bacterium]
MNRGRVRMAVIGVGVACLLLRPATVLADTHAPGHLAFNEGDGHLVVVDEDGSHRRILGGGRFAGFSRDGATVYFADGRPGFSALPWNGGRARPVTPAGACGGLSLSPDKAHLAYDRGCDPKYGNQFVVTRLDGSDRHILEDGDGGSRWSRDGRWLAWVGCRGLIGCPLTGVRVFDTTAGASRDVGSGTLYGWSPDGAWLTLSDLDAGSSDTHHLVIEHADGSGRRTLPVKNPSGLAWAPDGHRLVAAQGSQLVVVDVDAGTSRALTDTHDDQGIAYLEWSPDGSTITFMEPSVSPPPFDPLQLVGVSPDGTNRRVIFGPGNVALHEPAAWAPDSQAIAVEGDVGDTDHLFIVNVATGAATRVSLTGQHAGATFALMLGGWGQAPAPVATSRSVRASAIGGTPTTTSTAPPTSTTTTSTTLAALEASAPVSRRRHSGAAPIALGVAAAFVVAGIGGIGLQFRRRRAAQ